MKKEKEVKKRVNSKKGKHYDAEKKHSMREEVDAVKDSADLKNHSKYGNPNWYFQDKDLAEQASRFSFQSFIGTGEISDEAKLPSIATIALNPAVGGYVGVTQDYDPIEDNASLQAVNLMARKLYSRLSANSGRTPSYQPQDVIFSILGIGEVISLVSHLRRVIGLAFTYNYRNRDFPSNIIRALGVNPDDLYANLAKYRVEFNTILNMANKIPILANITWFSKCSALYEGIFQDSPDEMAQMYVMVPASTWIIDESSSELGTVLKTVPVCIDLQTDSMSYKPFSDYLNILKGMINALLTSTTYNIIYADILNMVRKQDVPLMQLDLIDENYGVIPQYDEEVLLHLHNLNCFRYAKPDYFQNQLVDLTGRTTSNANDVFQDPNTNNVMYAPLFDLYESASLTDIATTLDQAAKVIDACDVVDFPYGNPDLTERIEATRFSIRLNSNEIIPGETGEDVWAYARTLPDHFASHIFIWVAGSTSKNVAVGRMVPSTTISSINNFLLTNMEKFRYFPLVYRFSTTGQMNYIAGDLNYYTRLDGIWLKRLNSLCLQGLLELR